MELGAYHLDIATDKYLWRERLCPSCRTEWPLDHLCHLEDCGSLARTQTLEEAGLPPMPECSPLIASVERLAGRVVQGGGDTPRRVVLSELQIAIRGGGLVSPEVDLLEELIRTYSGATAREERRRFEAKQAEAKAA